MGEALAPLTSERHGISLLCMLLSVQVSRKRSGSDVFLAAALRDEPGFLEIVSALQVKGFKVDVSRFELTGTICLTVPGLRSDKASSYATDLIMRAGRKAGFHFTGASHQ